MKLKKILKLCKQAEQYLIYDNRQIADQPCSNQWIGTRDALYLPTRMPYLVEDIICTMCDLSEKQRNDWDIQHDEQWAFDWSLMNEDPSDTPADLMGLSIMVHGEELLPLKVEKELVWIWSKYLTPLEDDLSRLTFHYREANGCPYIIVKDGMFIIASIRPEDIKKDKSVVERMGQIAAGMGMRVVNADTGEILE